MSKKFEHDSIVCHVQKVSGNTEKHGDQSVLAVAVHLRAMEPEQWSAIASGCWGIPKDNSGELLQSLGETCVRYDFADQYEGHTVNFRKNDQKLVTIQEAQIDTIRMQWGEKLGMTFRVYARASGETIGDLYELMGQKLRIETVDPYEGQEEEAQEGLPLKIADETSEPQGNGPDDDLPPDEDGDLHGDPDEAGDDPDDPNGDAVGNTSVIGGEPNADSKPKRKRGKKETAQEA